MNSVSWLLYGADLSRNLRTVLGTGAFIGLAAIPFSLVASAWMSDFTDASKETLMAVQGRWKAGAIASVVCGLLWALAPSQNTIMLIAASQVGETILAAPQAQQIGGEAGELATDSLRVLRKFINEQLAEPAAPAK